jgi:hypothetical protein
MPGFLIQDGSVETLLPIFDGKFISPIRIVHSCCAVSAHRFSSDPPCASNQTDHADRQ